nr:zinc finger BED domain-containing protein RICESLEEPER 2-like [Ipomoea batatas]
MSINGDGLLLRGIEGFLGLISDKIFHVVDDGDVKRTTWAPSDLFTLLQLFHGDLEEVSARTRFIQLYGEVKKKLCLEKVQVAMLELYNDYAATYSVHVQSESSYGGRPDVQHVHSHTTIGQLQSNHANLRTDSAQLPYLTHSSFHNFLLSLLGQVLPVHVRSSSTKAVEDQIDEAEDQTQPEKQYAGEALNVVVLHRRKLQYVGHWKLFRHPPPPEIAVGRHQSSTQATPNCWKLSRRPPPPEIAVRRHPSTTQATPNCWKLSRCPPSC